MEVIEIRVNASGVEYKENFRATQAMVLYLRKERWPQGIYW